MATLQTESLQRAGCFLTSEANKTRSRTKGILNHDALNAALQPGTVLGKIETGNTAAVAAKSGNSGNGVMGTVTVGDTARPGRYKVHIQTAATNAGAFNLIDPDGDVVGQGNVAAAFSGGGLSFTLADGSTDFAAGDEIYITVAPNAGEKWTVLNLAGTNGEDVSAGILFDTADATAADLPIVVVDADAEVRLAQLIWPAGFTAAQISTGVAQLQKQGIKFSPTY